MTGDVKKVFFSFFIDICVFFKKKSCQKNEKDEVNWILKGNTFKKKTLQRSITSLNEFLDDLLVASSKLCLKTLERFKGSYMNKKIIINK